MRGAATLLFCAFASGAGAQISGTASVASDYRYRGITLSDRKPAAQLGVTFDEPGGWYAGAFGSTIRLAAPVGASVQAIAFAGFASRLSSGISVEVGGDYSAFTGARRYGYGEMYLGAAAENVSARIYYSPRYFGQNTTAVYGEINGAHALIDRVRVFAHGGLLTTRSDSVYGPRSDQRVWDGRIGLGADFDSFQVELAWVGSSASGGYRFAGGRSPNAVVLTLSRSF